MSGCSNTRPRPRHTPHFDWIDPDMDPIASQETGSESVTALVSADPPSPTLSLQQSCADQVGGDMQEEEEDVDDLTPESCWINIAITRNFLTNQSLPEQTRQLFTLMLYYNHRATCLDPETALTMTSSSLQTPPSLIQSWHRQLMDGHLQPSLTPSPSSPPHLRCRRGSLLEEYPHLLQQAQQWVDHCFKRCEIDPLLKPYKITEFQQWCNDHLLRPLFYDKQKRVQPISHSTARTWLQKLGYYDRLFKLQQEKQAEETPVKRQRAWSLRQAQEKASTTKIEGRRPRAHTVGALPTESMEPVTTAEEGGHGTEACQGGSVDGDPLLLDWSLNEGAPSNVFLTTNGSWSNKETSAAETSEDPMGWWDQQTTTADLAMNLWTHL